MSALKKNHKREYKDITKNKRKDKVFFRGKQYKSDFRIMQKPSINSI